MVVNTDLPKASQEDLRRLAVLVELVRLKDDEEIGSAANQVAEALTVTYPNIETTVVDDIESLVADRLVYKAESLADTRLTVDDQAKDLVEKLQKIVQSDRESRLAVLCPQILRYLVNHPESHRGFIQNYLNTGPSIFGVPVTKEQLTDAVEELAEYKLIGVKRAHQGIFAVTPARAGRERMRSNLPIFAPAANGGVTMTANFHGNVQAQNLAAGNYGDSYQDAQQTINIDEPSADLRLALDRLEQALADNRKLRDQLEELVKEMNVAKDSKTKFRVLEQIKTFALKLNGKITDAVIDEVAEQIVGLLS